jgi:hypothetical protein
MGIILLSKQGEKDNLYPYVETIFHNTPVHPFTK